MTITGRIYKITSAQTDNIYIGSTTKTLKQRLSTHKCDYKRYLKNKTHYKSGYDIVKFDDAIIELIEEKEFNDKYEMLLCENKHMKSNNKCVNKINAVIPKEEKHGFKCPCGGSYNSEHKQRHNRTQKHMNHMKTINITVNITCNKVEICKND